MRPELLIPPVLIGALFGALPRVEIRDEPARYLKPYYPPNKVVANWGSKKFQVKRPNKSFCAYIQQSRRHNHR